MEKKKIFIKPTAKQMTRLRQQQYQQQQQQYYPQPSTEDKPKGDGCLCFILGGLLGPIGLIVAAIISKAAGVRAALMGWFICWFACWGILKICYYFL